MNIFIVHAHAEPKSFNGTLSRAAKEHLTDSNYNVEVFDLI
jgi:putative NADPH-quinone reductase